MTSRVKKQPDPRFEFGDYQTPVELAADVCRRLAAGGLRPASVVEPTCGIGHFLLASADQWGDVRRMLGFDVNPTHVGGAAARLSAAGVEAELQVANCFEQDWGRVIRDLPEPILILGNPPWVTNSALGAGGGVNLPRKSNFQQHRGMDAMTGKSNFDICESILLRLFEAVESRRATVAMLCKSSVARKVLSRAWDQGMSLDRCSLHRIDARLHFGVNVEAVLLVAEFAPTGDAREASFFTDLTADAPDRTLARLGNRLIANTEAYRRSADVRGGTVRWRSGVKHDAAKVMEFTRTGDGLTNGHGRPVDIEPESVFPLLKSSDVAGGRSPGRRFMLVPQRRIGQPTSPLAETAPKTWAYLNEHADRLDARRSSIYKSQPRFAVFGIGPYTFAPWKIAVSGFYKKLAFRVVGPLDGRPVVFDDTVYFLPFATEADARRVAAALAGPAAADYFAAFVFSDAKRPVTADLLGGLDLTRLVPGVSLPSKSRNAAAQQTLW